MSPDSKSAVRTSWVQLRCLLPLLPLLAVAQLQAQVAPPAAIGFRTNAILAQETDASVSVVLYRDGNPEGTNQVRVTGNLGIGNQTPLNLTPTVVTFTPGMTEFELPLPVTDNDEAVPNRSLSLALSAITSRTFITNRFSALIITVPDDDLMTFQLEAPTYTFSEDDTNATVSILRAGNLRVPATIDLRVADPSTPPPAGAPRLYLVSTQSVAFAASESRRSVQIPLQPNPGVTGPSSARLLLANVSTASARFAAPSNATLTVLDIHGSISLGTNIWAPPGATEVAVRIDRSAGTASGRGVLSLEGRTAQAGVDFNGTQIPFEFPPGSNSLVLTIPLLDNPERIHGRWLNAALQSTEPLALNTQAISIWIPPSASALASGPRYQVDPVAIPAGFPTNLSAIAPGPDASWYLAGSFLQPPGMSSSNLIRVTRSFTPAASWNPLGSPNGRIRHAAAFPDGRLLAGGDFTAWAGHPRSRLALLNPDGSLADTGSTLDVPGITRILADVRGRVYVNGPFSQLGGLDFPGLARFASSGDLEAFFRPAVAASGSFVQFAPLAPEGLALLRPDSSFLFLDDSGASNGSVGAHFFVAGTASLNPLPDGSVVPIGSGFRLLPGEATDFAIAPLLQGTTRTWPAANGGFYRASLEILPDAWRLTRHWGDGTPDPRMEIWFQEAPILLAEATDGTVLVTGTFRRVDGQPAAGLAQFLPPPTFSGIRWHAGTNGFVVGERARHFRAAAVRETGLESAREIALPLPPSPALATDAPTTVPLRFEAGARIGWANIPLRNQTEPGPDLTLELRLPDADRAPDAPAGLRVLILRDEQTFGFSHRTRILPEPIMPSFSSTAAETRPHLAVRRLSGIGYPGSTQARFVGGTVRAEISPFPLPGVSREAFDFFAHTGEIPVSFPPGTASVALLVAPYDNAITDGDRTAEFTLDGPGPADGLAATIVVRDNDQRGPAGAVGPFESFQLSRGPLLLRGQTFVDGTSPVGYQFTLPDGWPVGTPFQPRGGFSMTYLGPGPGSSQYLLEYNLFSPNNGARLQRLGPDGRTDSTFQPIDFSGSGFGTGRSIPAASGPDGSIYVLTRDNGVSLSIGPGIVSRILRRYRNDGTLDASYAGQVHVPQLQAGGGPQPMEATLLPQADGGILVLAAGAFATNATQADVVRLLPSGAVDPSFRAQLVFPFQSAPGTGSKRLGAAALDSQGRCLLQGNFERIDGFPRPGFARLKPDGRIDATFNPRFLDQYPGLSLNHIVPMPDGRTLITLVSPSRSTLLVLTETGAPDPAVTPVQVDGWINSVVVLPGGVVAFNGAFQEVQGSERFNEAWLDPALRLLGTAPLAIHMRGLDTSTLRFDIHARSSGTFRIERGSLDRDWQAIGEFQLAPGASTVSIPAPADDAAYFRATRLP